MVRPIQNLTLGLGLLALVQLFTASSAVPVPNHQNLNSEPSPGTIKKPMPQANKVNKTTQNIIPRGQLPLEIMFSILGKLHPDEFIRVLRIPGMKEIAQKYNPYDLRRHVDNDGNLDDSATQRIFTAYTTRQLLLQNGPVAWAKLQPTMARYNTLTVADLKASQPAVFTTLCTPLVHLITDRISKMTFDKLHKRIQPLLTMDTSVRVAHDLARVAIVHNQLDIVRFLVVRDPHAIESRLLENWKLKMNLAALYYWALNLDRPQIAEFLASKVEGKQAVEVSTACINLQMGFKCGLIPNKIPTGLSYVHYAMTKEESLALMLFDTEPVTPFIDNLYVPIQ
ncbi:hypothetical protein H4R33_001466 [Dimargaris cristalligena]|uniref:F-box domain-containing protein n=1 Tax=Dimargaris cristalligena TaxID=215637 RepID=A0A4Q0A474_9FUNG|nr:hypothetical protein H4R33_001466 [Dimargaris cristalligena]RKP40060.1 hypothetical protein BJ085DRAFT_37838 [Dimargaris cristalligena]|eukprot:RKP40060.1 hypothetical protein BJ085DRAFT_37838 [Dimargaris cristalligena]